MLETRRPHDPLRRPRRRRSRLAARFAPGTLTAIVGPNGAGKTTYFNLISGQLRASAGSVWLDGADITGESGAARARTAASAARSS